MRRAGRISARVTLVVVHYHLRPGGVRRIIELATPWLAAGMPLTRVVLATGEAASAAWHRAFARSLAPVPVEVRLAPAFRYRSEQRLAPAAIARQVRRALARLLAAGDCAVWIHNPGVGRNLALAREVAAACARRGIPLLAHHHDWWFDQRWQRWPEIRRSGFPTLACAARAVFPPAGHAVHLAINRADAAVLTNHPGARARWVPNLAIPAAAPPPARVRAARRWLRGLPGPGAAPVWLVASRTLRRKNLGEALLLTRWLRPGAWLLVTGGPSSADEAPYHRALQQAARRHGWPLLLGILAGRGGSHPPIPDLLAACEAAVFTSVHEGFGLPYLEAAAAGRPLVARRLPLIMPDLARFGLRFPHSYDEVFIDPRLFDWPAERGRQAAGFRRWRNGLPRAVRGLAAPPALLAHPRPAPVAFSRLTLAAQLEVLAHPASDSWAACLPWNPQLARWRRLAAAGALRPTRWPRRAQQVLGGDAYARRLRAALAAAALPPDPGAVPVPSAAVQADFIRRRLAPEHLHPLLWQCSP